jgi:hypothetical protein
VRFIEGPHVVKEEGVKRPGGWFGSLGAEMRINGEWEPVPSNRLNTTPSPRRAFEILEWNLEKAVEATGVRLRGAPGGEEHYVTISELEGILKQ